MKVMVKHVLRACVIVLLFLLAISPAVAAQAPAPTAPSSGVVTLLEPEDDARFDPKTNILLRADFVSAAPTNGALRIEFFADRKKVGSVIAEPYNFVWSNVPAGSYQLHAVAVLKDGAIVPSDSIRIRVYSALITFGLDRIPALERNRLFDIPLWQYCASIIYIFLAFYISKALDFLTRIWLKKFTARTKTQFDDLLLDLLNGPVKIIVFVIFLRIGLEVFSWPLMIRNFLSKAFIIVVAFTITYALLKFVDLAIGYWRDRTRADADSAFDEQLLPIVRKSLKLFVVVVAALVTLANLNVNITAALASLSIGGLAIGLAAQDTLANLFGAVAVFADKPFRIGDSIQLADVSGTVESIGLRSTRVRNGDGYLITIPNKTMGNATITNVARRLNIRTEMNLGLTHETSTEKLRQALLILDEVYRGHPLTVELTLSFNKFTESTLNINVVHLWKGTDNRAYLAGIQEMNLKVKERFDAEGIRFAHPSRNIYVKQGSVG
jgi:MscS family membrane protein